MDEKVRPEEVMFLSNIAFDGNVLELIFQAAVEKEESHFIRNSETFIPNVMTLDMDETNLMVPSSKRVSSVAMTKVKDEADLNRSPHPPAERDSGERVSRRPRPDPLIMNKEKPLSSLENTDEEKPSTHIPSEINAVIDRHLGLKFLYLKPDGTSSKRKTKYKNRTDEKRNVKWKKPQSRKKTQDDEEKEAEEVECKMHIIALLKEIEERDKLISMLKLQLQIKEQELFLNFQTS